MKSSFGTGAVVALVLVVVASLLGVYALGTFADPAKDPATDALDPLLNGGDGSSSSVGEEDGAATNPSSGNAPIVELVLYSYPERLAVGQTDRVDLWTCTPDGQFYTGYVTFEVEITPSGGVVGAPGPGDQAGLCGFTICFEQTGDYLVKITPHDSELNVIGASVEFTVSVLSEQGDGDGGDGEPGTDEPGTGEDNQTADIVVLVPQAWTPYSLAGAEDFWLRVSAINTSDGGVYTGDLDFQVDLTPSSDFTVTYGPVPTGILGDFSFRASFDQLGNYTMSVTPTDGEGNVIGDPIEVSVTVVPEGTIAMMGTGTRTAGENHTAFYMELKLFSEVTHAGAGFDVTRIVLEIDGKTFESTGFSFARNNLAEVSVVVPNSEFTPGAPYIITAYYGDQVVGTASGTAPS